MKEHMLIIGGTGKTGRKVVERLTRLGYPVRIGSRSATPAFDWQAPETWDSALEGIDKIYITFQPDLAVPGAKEAIALLVEKAKAKNIKKLVLLSGKGEKEAEACEAIVANAGIPYTLVRASWFSQNFSESFFLDPIISGQVALPKPEAKVPYIDTNDIADVVTAALTDDSHNAKTYQLTGPRVLTFEEVTKEIAEASGRDISFTPITLEEYTTGLKSAGVPDDYIWLINYLFTEVLGTPGNNEVTHDVKEVLGREARDFSEYVRETAKSGIWNTPVQA